MSRDDIAIALEELADAIRDLGEAIDERSRTNTGAPRPNLLSPPSVTDVLRAADELAIPALITLLEAQIRTLRYLQRGSRFVRRGTAVDDRLRGPGPGERDRYGDPDVVLDRLGSTLDLIGRRLEDSADEETRDLFDRTRSLYEEIDGRLADYERRLDDERESADRAEGYRIEISEPSDSDSGESSRSGVENRDRDDSGAERDDDRVDVDVDAELETLRERYGPDGDTVPKADDAEDDRSDRPGEPSRPDRQQPSDGVDRTADGTENAGAATGTDTSGESDTEDPAGEDRSETEDTPDSTERSVPEDGAGTDDDTTPSADDDGAENGETEN